MVTEQSLIFIHLPHHNRHLEILDTRHSTCLSDRNGNGSDRRVYRGFARCDWYVVTYYKTSIMNYQFEMCYELISLRYLHLKSVTKYLSPVNDAAAAIVAIHSLYLHLDLLMLAMLKSFKKK